MPFDEMSQRPLSWLVKCPKCGAKKYKPCQSASGRIDMNYTHRARLDLLQQRCGVMEDD